MITIRAKVGQGGTNHPVDVMIIQFLLNANAEQAGLNGYLDVTGEIDRSATDAIKAFQKNALKVAVPDGRVDPGGKTLKTLAAAAAGVTDITKALRKVVSGSGAPTRQLGIIDGARFVLLYDREFAQLNASARQGLGWLIDFINSDKDVTDVAQCAYMLATVKLECAERWKPIEEFGKGAGHTYGNPVTFTENGKSYTNTYYGRGYVQITWKDNYKRLGKAIGMGDQLMLDPTSALDPAVSYAVMSLGMRKGLFTGKKLADYINQSGIDYVNARKIINGLNAAPKIGGYAERIEMLLRVTC